MATEYWYDLTRIYGPDSTNENDPKWVDVHNGVFQWCNGWNDCAKVLTEKIQSLENENARLLELLKASGWREMRRKNEQ